MKRWIRIDDWEPRRVDDWEPPTSTDLTTFFDDLKEIKWHNIIIENARNIVESITEVQAVFLKGSFANDTADIFSDIDFVIMHDGTEKTAEHIKKQFLEHLSEIGRVIHIYFSTVNMKDLIIYFTPYIKFELFIRSFDYLKKSWKIASSKILYDKAGWGKIVLTETAKNIFKIENFQEEIGNYAIAFPSLCYIIAGYVRRGEHLTAFNDLDWLRDTLLRISSYFLGFHWEGVRRAEFEGKFPADILDYYTKTRVSKVTEIYDSLNIILEWYCEWFIPNVEKYFGKIPNTKHQVKPLRVVLQLFKDKKEIL